MRDMMTKLKLTVNETKTRLCRGPDEPFREQTETRWSWLATDELVGRLNRVLRGWANYFCLGTVTKAYRKVTAHACHRLRQWLVRKHPVQGSKWARYGDRYLHDTLGLLRLQRRPLHLSCANV
jgi:hypothetical protein